MAYSGMMFSLPSSIVDENICLAGTVQLKAILYLFRRSALGESVTCAQIAKAIKYDEEDVADAMIFWLEKGLVIKAENNVAPAVINKVSEIEHNAPPIELPLSPAKEQPKKIVADIPVSKPSHEQVAIRLEECAEFRELFAEAQTKLGKTIGYDGQSTLIMLHDSYGLPIEVILMLIEYSKNIGKTGYSNLASLGRSWAENDIDTLEAAESYIEEQTGVDALWNEFRKLTGAKNLFPTTKQRRFFSAWRGSYGFDVEMIYLAYEKSIENTEKMSLPYMEKVLKSWYEKGIKTPMDVEAQDKKWAEQKMSSKSSKTKNEKDAPSYDLDAYAKKSVHLKYKKKTED